MPYAFLRMLAATPRLLLVLFAAACCCLAWSVLFPVVQRASPASALTLHDTRSSPLDLEVAGELSGSSPGMIHYIRREELLTLPQTNFTVTDDPNFIGATHVGGVLLGELARQISANPQSDLIVAICDDQYRTIYPHSYIASHHPVLVLTINGKSPEGWPKGAEGHGLSMGPYMISHASFTPAFKLLSHSDEPQIPWGVVRLEFRNEQEVLRAIAPRGSHANDPQVQAGYQIAQQNCFRCHNSGPEGGTKAQRPWLVLSTRANSAPDYFAAYVRNPKAKNPRAQMPGNPNYDDATIAALIAYFRTFLAKVKP